MNQLAIGVPLRPSTPQPSGWSSAISPLPLKVVITGRVERSASATTASISKRAPWPTMIAGRLASRCSRPRRRGPRRGAISRGGMRPSGAPAVASGAGRTLHLVGEDQVRDAALDDGVLEARSTSSAMLAVVAAPSAPGATPPNAAARSTSWKAPGPSTCVSTWPVSASAGARSTLASQRPVSRLVAPGPAIASRPPAAR